MMDMHTIAEVEEAMQILDPGFEVRVQVFPVDVLDGTSPLHLVLPKQRWSTMMSLVSAEEYATSRHVRCRLYCVQYFRYPSIEV